MATTHLYSQFGSNDWSTPAKFRNMWVMTSGGWTLLSNVWAFDGVSWQRSFTTTPGPLDHIILQYDSLEVSSGGTLDFSVVGVDADGLGIGFGSETVQWTVTTDADTITPYGDGTSATFTAGDPGGWTTQVNVAVYHFDPYGGGYNWWSAHVTVTVD
jgi:hypothetical protein